MVLEKTQCSAAVIVRWAARVSSLLAAGIIAVFATSGGDAPTAAEWTALAFFPVGVLVGMFVAWKREIPGAIISLGSLGIFYGYMFATSSFGVNTRYVGSFAMFAIPAVLFLATGLLARREGSVGT